MSANVIQGGPEADTAGEAAVGLAPRRDPRLFGPLVERLSDPDVGNLWVEAAAELGDHRLLPRLLHLKSSRWQDDEPRPEVLDHAIHTCARHAQGTQASPEADPSGQCL